MPYVELYESATREGNTFNGASQLVRLDASNKMPSVSAENMTNVIHGYACGQYVLSASQTTDTGQNDHVKFDTVFFENDPTGLISLQSSGSYSNGTNTASIGRVTLKAGYTYKITGVMAVDDAPYCGYSIFNSDTNTRIGTYASTFAHTTIDSNVDSQASYAFITAASDTRIELRKTSVVSIYSFFAGNNALSGCSIMIECWY